MSKPEDISQEAWDAADITFDLETYGNGGLYHLDAQIKIARAIMAATLAEREACIRAMYDATDFAHEERDIWLKAEIFDAIRKRDEPLPNPLDPQ